MWYTRKYCALGREDSKQHSITKVRHKTVIFEHDRVVCLPHPNWKWAWTEFLASVAGWCENHHTKIEVCSCYTFQVISVLKWKSKCVIWSLFSYPDTHSLETGWAFMRNKPQRFCRLLSHTKLLTSIAYKLKQSLCYFNSLGKCWVKAYIRALPETRVNVCKRSLITKALQMVP